MIEFAYNDHVHSRIGVSLFYVLYSQEYRTIVTHSNFDIKLDIVNEMIRKIEKIRESAKLASA